LMILKYYDPTSQGNNNLKNTIKAIEYAVKMNAHIINYSGGGLEPSAQELAAIKKARDKGVLFVAAAGNESSNSDQQKYYPADYDLDNIISVTAIDKNSNVLSSSNYGVNTVDVAAPGNDIYSTLPGGQYGVMTGTSQATAFVTGVGALLMGHNKEFRKADRVIKYLLKTGDYNEGLTSKTRHKRLLNVYRALTILDQGTSLNGVMAENTSQSFNISTDSEVKITDERSPSNMAAFAKELSKLINKEKKLSDSDNNRQPVNY
ncbi:MAG: S8 family serine peptidase, partial [Bdellovibrionales bacterium]|nr:S8 family serine peptidase [Bdellovibrionales bacterium]